MPSGVSFHYIQMIYCNHLTKNTVQTLLLTFFILQRLLEFFGAGDRAVLLPRVRMRSEP